MIHDYKFRHSTGPSKLRRSRRRSGLVRFIIFLLSVAVLILVGISVYEMWGEDGPESTPSAPESIPLPLPPRPSSEAETNIDTTA